MRFGSFVQSMRGHEQRPFFSQVFNADGKLFSGPETCEKSNNLGGIIVLHFIAIIDHKSDNKCY